MEMVFNSTLFVFELVVQSEDSQEMLVLRNQSFSPLFDNDTRLVYDWSWQEPRSLSVCVLSLFRYVFSGRFERRSVNCLQKTYVTLSVFCMFPSWHLSHLRIWIHSQVVRTEFSIETMNHYYIESRQLKRL